MFSRLLNRSTDKSEKPAKPDEMPVVRRGSDIDELLSRDRVMLFKHSAACPVSWMALAHVNRFRSRNPGMPVHIIPVIEERATSMEIAARIRVRHESPQIIVLRKGVVASVASHEAITEDHLHGVVASL